MSGRPTVMSLIGAVLDERYQLLSLLGEGGMGAVYDATRLEDGASVAVKVLLEELGDHPEIRERFEREAKALFGLSHPNILAVHDYGLVEGRPYLVMDKLEGQTLDEMLEEDVLSASAAEHAMLQILDGLAFAHEQGAVHRDLKSENIHVGTAEARRITLLDFGLVKFTDDDRWGKGSKLTAMGTVFGTPAYMAPEQCTGAATDARSDVYAAGVILYEMLTGEWPFMVESRLEMFKAHLTTPPPALPVGVGTPEMSEVIQRAMDKLPAKRFADASEMAAALRGTSAPTTAAASPAPEEAPPAEEPEPFPWKLVVGAAALVLLLVVVALTLPLLAG